MQSLWSRQNNWLTITCVFILQRVWKASIIDFTQIIWSQLRQSCESRIHVASKWINFSVPDALDSRVWKNSWESLSVWKWNSNFIYLGLRRSGGVGMLVHSEWLSSVSSWSSLKEAPLFPKEFRFLSVPFWWIEACLKWPAPRATDIFQRSNVRSSDTLRAESAHGSQWSLSNEL